MSKKRYRTSYGDVLLLSDDFEPVRNALHLFSPKYFIFTPGGGCAGSNCHCISYTNCYSVTCSTGNWVAYVDASLLSGKFNVGCGWGCTNGSQYDCAFSGEYVLTSGWGQSCGACCWGTNPGGWPTTPEISLLLVLDDPSTWHFRVIIYHTCWPMSWRNVYPYGVYAIYDSSQFSVGNCDDARDANGEISLSKTSSTLACGCTGAMPDTITIYRPT
jgi:hypothetical protein